MNSSTKIHQSNTPIFLSSDNSQSHPNHHQSSIDSNRNVTNCGIVRNRMCKKYTLDKYPIMKQFYSLAFAMLFLIPSFLIGQSEPCGINVTQEEMAYLLELNKDFDRFSSKQYRASDINLPIKVHIVTKDEGSSNVTEQSVSREIMKLNDLFADAGFEFYMHNEVNYIESDRYYTYQMKDEGKLAGSNDLSNVINVYFVSSISDNHGNTVCGYTQLPGNSTPKNRIFIGSGCLNGATLAHEMGHYLGLLHTHGHQTDDELVDGSNCDIAGDLLCDTPADPKLTGNVNGDCSYTGTELDNNGLTYNPDTDNIMSYTPSYCRSRYSDKQIDKMIFTYLNTRNYLDLTDDYVEVGSFGKNAAIPQNNEEARVNISLFPNPTRGQINVQFQPEHLDGEVMITVSNMLGVVIYEEQREVLEENETLNFDLSPYNKGIYFVSVAGEKLLAGTQVIYQ